MTLTFPIGSSVYFILAVIYLLSFPPISGADNSDFVKRVFIGIPFEIKSFFHGVMVDSDRKNSNI
jgi:hypothetical protein